MKLYRLSPIKSQVEVERAVAYIATKATELGKNILGRELPIESLTIFSHYPEEFEKLQELLLEMGDFYNENNGPRVVLSKPIKAGNNLIKYLRVRRPDIYRAQVGCNDFKVNNYQDFKKINLSSHPFNLRLIKRENYEMIEFFDPDFDVLSYVVSD